MIVKVDIDGKDIITERERMVFRQMMDGKTDKEIAEKYKVTTILIALIKDSIYEKMGG